jgi:hypothetical protein
MDYFGATKDIFEANFLSLSLDVGNLTSISQHDAVLRTVLSNVLL